MSGPNPGIFREYDIRGTVDVDLEPSVAFLVGKGFGTYLRRRGERRAVIGRDNRASSHIYGEAARAGVRSAGVDVIDIGLVTTPVLYYAVGLYGASGGLMVTGSHNPPDQNGFKLVAGGESLYGAAILEIRDTIGRGTFTGGYSHVSFADPTRAYLDMLLDKLAGARSRGRPLKVAVDAGNGVAGIYAVRLLESLGHTVIPLYCDPDPDFPNHFPDPVLPENLVDLERAVRTQGCDLGVAYDGDGDRLGVVDDRGDVAWGDLLMLLFWRDILPRHPGATALVEVKCSQALVDDIRRLGGRPEFCRTGHSLVKARLRENGAPFAGEMSGHLFFADEYFGFDDALYATGRLIRLLAQSGRSLSRLLADVPRYPATPEVRVPCPDDAKFEAVEAIKRSLSGTSSPGRSLVEVDGVRIVYPDGWGLVRASNTQAALTVRCEGTTPEALGRIKREIRDLLERCPEAGPLPW